MTKKKSEQVREHLITYDDYAKLPDDGVRYELSNGKLEAMTTAPHPIHQLISQEMAVLLKKSCKQEYITFTAPVDVILSNTEVRQPDLIMVHRNRIEMITHRGIEGTPDLIAEVLSPSSIKRDRVSKQTTYAKYAIPEYWIIDPIHQSLEQYVLEGKRYNLQEVYMEKQTVQSQHLACASFSMFDIFANIPELPNA
ncbi:Uma2 family endonuclease [Aquibacillus sp. 3ASR75-11]|uniref:Uma2 family endonuclease n=1 Tax=Terrihalobacillus insolitus TaxID=2950438 RepID=A0A9X3WPZ8_9BACI|nr:Uma2 family endonuclease [Terrihalobacillus insolitus]MDC3412231.1 Uma2 family endonuclease [Terrihalobacillus insolitus]MDC3423075.1 Uma2 family endonuclease [Terrihalobacillus insolitus]